MKDEVVIFSSPSSITAIFKLLISSFAIIIIPVAMYFLFVLFPKKNNLTSIDFISSIILILAFFSLYLISKIFEDYTLIKKTKNGSVSFIFIVKNRLLLFSKSIPIEPDRFNFSKGYFGSIKLFGGKRFIMFPRADSRDEWISKFNDSLKRTGCAGKSRRETRGASPPHRKE